jgi:hypothetical protein
MESSPHGFADSSRSHFQFGARNVRIGFTVVEFYGAQIVLISATAVYQFAKKAFANHFERCHHVAPVAYVFENHELRTGFFGSVHQIPAFVHRVGGRNFHTYIRHSGFHGCNRHGHMPFPRTGNQYYIEFFVGEHFFVFMFTSFVNFRKFFPFSFKGFFGHVERKVGNIANRHDFGIVE